MEQQLGLDLREPARRSCASTSPSCAARSATARASRARTIACSGAWRCPSGRPRRRSTWPRCPRKMLELAGEIADGVVLWLCRPALRPGRRRAGARARTAASRQDPRRLRDRRRGAARRHGRAGQGARRLPRRARAVPVAAVLSRHARGERPWRRAEALRPPAAPPTTPWSTRSAPSATARGVARTSTPTASAGVTLPAIRPITFPDAPWYRRTLEEAVPLVTRVAHSPCSWRRRARPVAEATRTGALEGARTSARRPHGCGPVRGPRRQHRRGRRGHERRAELREPAARPTARRVSDRARRQPRRGRRDVGRRGPASARPRDRAAPGSGHALDRTERHHHTDPLAAYERNLDTILGTPASRDDGGRRRESDPRSGGDAALRAARRARDGASAGRPCSSTRRCERQATAHGAELVDLYAASQREVPARPELIAADGYHPSDAGYARWAELVVGGRRGRASTAKP